MKTSTPVIRSLHTYSLVMFLTTLLVAAAGTLRAQDSVITLKPNNSRIYIVKELTVYADSTGQMNFEQFRKDSSLHVISGDKIGRPQNLTYWARVVVRSGYDADMVYRITASWWDYLDAYLVYPNDSVVAISTGLLRTTTERRGVFATFVLPARQSVTVFARLRSSGHFIRMDNVNLFLQPHLQSLENERYFMYLSGILVGILIGFSFYNLSFSTSVDRSYVWYFIYLLSLALSFSGQMGTTTSYLTQYFLPEHPMMGLFLKRLSDPVAFVSLVVFTIYFLETRSALPVMHRVLVLAIVLEVSYSSYWLLGFGRSSGVGIFLHLFSVGASLLSAVIRYRKGFRVARFFVAGQALVFFGILHSFASLTFGLDLLEWLPTTRFFVFLNTTTPHSFGAAEALIFSLALSERQRSRLEQKVTERTEELNDSLTALKATQSQLIQSEKMASLGELTAGIAHEIQNPLNFVKNFSEVNSELLAELEQEAQKGNLEAVKGIARDIRDNEEKIVSHGKRADAIVKGMLQHSRASSGKKEPTDINALCDEYLRLAYHGLRAKDKSFNATFETHLDPAVGKVNVLPQEIGRVVLNLINNAFYAVTEKRKSTAVPYEPTVTVSTRKAGSHIEIRVSDNGTGIPEAIRKKIFQPFFTTKPTGQGTGLGLSLSYDIVTKGHGGELLLESTEGAGTEFVVRLPVG